MTRHRRPFAPLSVAFTLLVAGLTLGQPASAAADDFCAYQDQTPPTITGFGPSSVTLGLHSEPVQFFVHAEDECAVQGWSLDTPDRFLFFVYKDQPQDRLVPFDNEQAGTTAVDVGAVDEAYNASTRRFTFRLLRQTRWVRVQATPEPVDQGDRVTIKGTLQRADWEKQAYVRFGGSRQRATVQFRAKGSDRWVSVKTVEFASTGRISTRVTVEGDVARDGWYRLHFAGTGGSSGAASTPNYVDVRE